MLCRSVVLSVFAALMKFFLSGSTEGGGLRASSHAAMTVALVSFSVFAFFSGTQLRSTPDYSLVMEDGSAQVGAVIQPPLPPLPSDSFNSSYFGFPTLTQLDVMPLTMDTSSGSTEMDFAPDPKRYAWLVASPYVPLVPTAPIDGHASFGCNVTESFRFIQSLIRVYRNSTDARPLINGTSDPDHNDASRAPFWLTLSLEGGGCSVVRKIALVQFWSAYVNALRIVDLLRSPPLRNAQPVIGGLLFVDNRNRTGWNATASSLSGGGFAPIHVISEGEDSSNGDGDGSGSSDSGSDAAHIGPIAHIDYYASDEYITRSSQVNMERLTTDLIDINRIASEQLLITPTNFVEFVASYPLVPTVLLDPAASATLNHTFTAHPEFNAQLLISISTTLIPTVYRPITALSLVTPLLLMCALLFVLTAVSSLEQLQVAWADASIPTPASPKSS